MLLDLTILFHLYFTDNLGFLILSPVIVNIISAFTWTTGKFVLLSFKLLESIRWLDNADTCAFYFLWVLLSKGHKDISVVMISDVLLGTLFHYNKQKIVIGQVNNVNCYTQVTSTANSNVGTYTNYRDIYAHLTQPGFYDTWNSKVVITRYLSIRKAKETILYFFLSLG